jgi:hypothetical protein
MANANPVGQGKKAVNKRTKSIPKDVALRRMVLPSDAEARKQALQTASKDELEKALKEAQAR